MKIHLISGAAIGAVINLAFQLTDPASHLNPIELTVCAALAALAAALASWFQQPLPATCRQKQRSPFSFSKP
jgi:hypothetical protein